LLDVEGIPAIVRLVNQVGNSKHVQRRDIVVCTTARPNDDLLVQIVSAAGASVFRGSTDDLIDRLYKGAEAYGFDVVLEVDGDDICADPEYMDLAIEAVLSRAADVAVSGTGLPLGAGSKAFRAACLKRIFDTYVPGRNDTGFGYYLTKSGLFSVYEIQPVRPSHLMPDLRLTLDYPEDLEVFRQIYARAGKVEVTLDIIRGILDVAPELKTINSGLDPAYWERTKALLAQHPLKLRVDGAVKDISADL
jgi:spore coat polysaccharide biosynthesis protein SpsF (cytidylyltransferase family)